MDIRELKKRFIEVYDGDEKDIRIFASPGRVNLIGEHTDYNGGYVFPAALSMSSTVAVRTKNDRKLNLLATDLNEIVTAELDSLENYKGLKWGNYQLGVANELQIAGYKLTGCDMLFDDNVPLGAGLSSSAAIEVVTALTLGTIGNEANGIRKTMDMIEIAKLTQRAENSYVGVNCGIMDQFASAMGKQNHAIFLNCRNLEYKYVRLEIQGYKIVISNTNKKRSLVESKYNERRNECEKGFEELKGFFPAASCLGEISYAQYLDKKDSISDPIVRKRIEHVISEDDRVLRSVEALSKNDLLQFGSLMTASHNSLRDLYEVTGFELDTLVEEALKVDGVIGSRMTGAGFGGCTVSIVSDASVDNFMAQVGENYYNKTGIKASFYISEIGDGGRELK